jgi:two-component system response regulator HydG
LGGFFIEEYMAQRFTLIVCKDEAAYESLRTRLHDPGLGIPAYSAEDAVNQIQSRQIPVILIELDTPGSMETLIHGALSEDPDTQILVFAGSNQEQILAKSCLKNGAAAILPKPCDVEQLRVAVGRALQSWELLHSKRRHSAFASVPEALEFKGSSHAMRSLHERLAKLVAHEASVLITGETGTGRTRLAQLIHRQSGRAAEVLLAFDCERQPNEDHVRLLFGDGGVLESAGGATLYLREVGFLSPQAQEFLGRAIKDKEFTRPQSRRKFMMDARFISSSRERLPSLIQAGRFREDLYWQLCGVALDLPPLRERPGDAEEFFRHFTEEAARQLGKKAPALPEEIMRAVREHAFPGNVAELKALATLVVSLSDAGQAALGTLPAPVMAPFKIPRTAPAGSLALKPMVHEFEKQFILQVLRAVNGNQSKAARVLDIHRNTLILKMAEFGIPNKKGRTKKKLKL